MAKEKELGWVCSCGYHINDWAFHHLNAGCCPQCGQAVKTFTKEKPQEE